MVIRIKNNDDHFFRFGLIAALKTTRDVKKGEEFLAKYDYQYQQGPRWYKENFKAAMKKNPEFKESHAYLTNNVPNADLEKLDAEIKDFELPAHMTLLNEVETEPKEEKMAKKSSPIPIINRLLGSTYWY